VALFLFAPPALKRAAGVLVAVELAQGLVGVVQYLTHVPSLLVGLHMAGACAVWVAALNVLAHVRVPAAAAGTTVLHDASEAVAH